MPIHNNDIEEIFNKVAALLEIKGENQFRIRSYRNAARTVGNLSQNISDMISAKKDLTELPGIGKDLAGKIEEIVKTGKLTLLEQLKQEMPGELSKLMEISGLGAKRIAVVYHKLNVSTLSELEKAAKEHKIRDLPGFGEKTEAAVLEETRRLQQEETKRTKLVLAELDAESLVRHLKKARGLKRIVVAGSYRRRKETVKDLDILVSCPWSAKIMDLFVGYEDVRRVLSKGTTRSAVILRSGFQVDLRVIPEASYGAALQYFTGSKEHNIAIRKIAVQKKLKVNEYGVFRGDKRIAGKTEEEVYKQVGLPFIEPELRENRGEVEAARDGKLPRLVRLDNIRGDLHLHTTYTDGHCTIEEIVRAAKKRGYEYAAISDHSKRVTVAHGLKADQLRRQIQEINKINKSIDGIVILKAIEVDILEDGSLDLPDSVLKELDLTIGAIHSKFNLPAKKQTERIIRAMDNPYFNILAHPTGRLINSRPPYDLDMQRVMEAAKERGCFLELNAHPDRLDLNEVDCKMAKDIGVRVVISTDAHHINDLDYMRFGVGQARRGWLEPGDVLNTRKLSELKKALKRS